MASRGEPLTCENGADLTPISRASGSPSELPEPLKRRAWAMSAVTNGYEVVPAKIEIIDGQKRVGFPLGSTTTHRLRSVEDVRRHWDANPEHFPAIPTGDLVLVDLDSAEAEAWWSANGEPGHVMTSLRGRTHHYFRAREGQRVKTSSGEIAKDVDTRGIGGQSFICGHLPRLSQLPEAPEWLPSAGERVEPKKASPVIADDDPFEGAAGRTFTRTQALAWVESEGLKPLREAEPGTINTKTNTAAAVLSHFVPNFWSADEAFGMLCEALKSTVYDGRTWHVSRFRRVIDGSEPVADPWVAHELVEDAAPVADPDLSEDDEIEGLDPQFPDAFSDARLAERFAQLCFVRRFIWSPGAGWHKWDGMRWKPCPDVEPADAIRVRALKMGERLAKKFAGDLSKLDDVIKAFKPVLSGARRAAILKDIRGVQGVYIADEQLDAYPDLLNTPSGVVDLKTGEIGKHDPAFLLTKITHGKYVPGFRHPDWEKALGAIRDDAREWFQTRVGQGVSGHTTPDGVVLVLQGGGENGKSAVTTDGIIPALGDYAAPASVKLFLAGRGNDHSTERADLKDQRLLISEELTEGRSIDTTALKRIADVGEIKARKLYRDNMKFRTSHTLFITTNPVPVINETDHGTWRRLMMLRFPYTFRKPHEDLRGENDRPGDVTLKARIIANETAQHDAIVTWAVEGAVRWYSDRDHSLAPPASVELDTLEWRKSADRILGYALERLERDGSACVMATELRDDFNEWLRSNGHQEWSMETLSARLSDHEIASSWNLKKERTRDLERLSRRYLDKNAPCKSQAQVWRGIRFASATADDPSEATK